MVIEGVLERFKIISTSRQSSRRLYNGHLGSKAYHSVEILVNKINPWPDRERLTQPQAKIKSGEQGVHVESGQ